MRGTPSLALLAMRCGVSEYKCSPRRNENDDYGSIRVRPGAGAAGVRRARRLLRISDHEAPRRGEALRGRGAGEAIEG